MVRRMSYERGGPENAKPFTVDFYKLRNDLLQQRKLFEDTEFPPIASSIYYSKLPDSSIEWRRPGEITNDPKFFEEGASRFDVRQGQIGDCWLAASVASLTLNQELFFKVVPRDQSFQMNYAGIFHFRFWRFGRWVDVVIDDKLPTQSGELIFLHSSSKNEFWSALLEKAYAKVHGAYEAVDEGDVRVAMVDFTGGFCETLDLHKYIPNLFKIMFEAFERKSLIVSNIDTDPKPQGLITGHAYTITGIAYLNTKTDKIPLVRYRNPWGNENEWTGPWSDKSPEWQTISQEEKTRIGLVVEADGESWMSLDDFTKHMEGLKICNLSPDSLLDVDFEKGKKKWEISIFEDKWIPDVSAGGSDEFPDTFWRNPQYRVTLLEADEDKDEKKCTMVVALMQENRRALLCQGLDFLHIGFAIYYLPNPSTLPTPLDVNFFKSNVAVGRSSHFWRYRENCERFSLPPGTYCIVPSTQNPNEESEFLLRIFLERRVI